MTKKELFKIITSQNIYINEYLIKEGTPIFEGINH